MISDVNSAYRSNPTRFYIASYRSSTGSTSIKPPSSGNTNSINMFYKIESLNIPLTSIDYISVGNIKLIFGSDQIYGVILPRFILGYVQWMRNNKPDSSKEEPMYPVLYSSLKNDAYYLTAFGLANTAYNWVASCSTSVYTDNIPIKIATYAD